MPRRITIYIGHEKICPFPKKITRHSDYVIYTFPDNWHTRLSDGRYLRKLQEFDDGRRIYYISNENGRSLLAYFDWEFNLSTLKQESPQMEALK